jgi:hypothetical protein
MFIRARLCTPRAAPHGERMPNWPRRLLAVSMLTASLSGCISQVKPVDPGWDGSTAPDCTDSEGAVVADAVVSDVGFDVASHNRGLLGLIGAGLGVGFGISAAAGAHRVQECRNANAEYHIGRAAAEADADADAAPAAPPPPPPPPRGFYCASSPRQPATSVCTREADDCDHARDQLAVGIGTMSECALTERAWCFANHCYASRAECKSHRGPDSIGDCVGQR